MCNSCQNSRCAESDFDVCANGLRWLIPNMTGQSEYVAVSFIMPPPL